METQTNTDSEKREFPRYKCRDDRTAYVALRPAFKKVGSVVDVSMGGIGIKYTLMDEQDESLAESLEGEENPLSMDLFVSNNGFYLPALKCRLAYDKSNEPHSPFSSLVRFRQCGLKFDFDELTDEQKEKIEMFLKHYTAGEA